ncbi:NAD(P)H-binding protein [Bermanella marisrubri]|uniref:NAD(P)-binding domain-containing protein n=1 Tax=Bermanella marisrubri TaxID=207949 RepID=Q1N4I6_9GAMM|nr:NAD(P)H-binding protein [Bermanella marisrubri]EAT13442.1 hypothetical protein RED65_01740 [Oceanobacter sp. RED65] [Bermanella marisrubri]QIZ84189.1 NAD(P)H-binding protein [Bermanella marisrubri]
MHILMAGGSGATGQAALNSLFKDTPCDITLINRHHQPIDAPEGFHICQSSRGFSNLDDLEVNEIDVAICCLGTTIKQAGSQDAFKAVDLDGVLAFANLAKHRGCKRFIVISSVGANAQSKNFYLRTKGEMELGLERLGFEQLVILRPSLLLGQRHEFRLAESLASWLAPLLSPFLLGSLKQYRPTKIQHVGQCIAHLAHGDEHVVAGITLLDSSKITQIAD